MIREAEQALCGKKQVKRAGKFWSQGAYRDKVGKVSYESTEEYFYLLEVLQVPHRVALLCGYGTTKSQTWAACESINNSLRQERNRALLKKLKVLRKALTGGDTERETRESLLHQARVVFSQHIVVDRFNKPVGLLTRKGNYVERFPCEPMY